MEIRTKNLDAPQVVDEDLGQVRAVICTYGVVDRDGDVVQKGAIREGTPVILSVYNHSSITGSSLPVGKGVIRTYGDEAVLEGQYFMDTEAGRDAFRVVKHLALAGLGEWSWGFIPTEMENGEVEGKSVNIIKDASTFEASFVAMGAGVNTRTLLAKAAKPKKRDDEDEEGEDDEEDEESPQAEDEESPEKKPSDDEPKRKPSDDDEEEDEDDDEDDRPKRKPSKKKSLKFADEISEVVASVRSLRYRAADVLAMRQKKGKQLSSRSTDALGDLTVELKRLDALLADQSENESQDADEVARKAYLRILSQDI